MFKKLNQIIRNIIALKHIAVFNVIGLTIGMSSFILISIWTYTHLRYDRNFSFSDEVYLIQESDMDTDLVLPFNISAYVRDRFPNVSDIAMYQYWPDKIRIKIGNEVYYEELTSSEKDIVNILDFKFITSKPNLFEATSDIIINESTAQKFFGTHECIGKQVIISDSINALVAGVFKDFSSNSTFKPTSVCLFELNEALFKPCESWGNFCYYCLARINKQADHIQIGNKLTSELQKDHELDVRLSFYPLENIHLNHPGESQLYKHVWLVFCSGVLVVLVSCLNFINLLITSMRKRIRQITIKGILGASNSHHILDCFIEVVLYVFIALCLSTIISTQALPLLTEVLNQNPVEVFGISWFILMHVMVALLITMLVSIYPIFYISVHSFNNFSKRNVLNAKTTLVKPAFIIFQFSITIVIGIVAFVMQYQLNYTLEKDKGYDDKGVIIAECWDYPLQENKAAIKEFLSSHTGVQTFSFSNSGGFDGLGSRTSSFNPIDADKDAKEVYKVMYKGDEKLFETMGIQMLAGRTFLPNKFNESNSIIINETFANQLGGLDSALITRLKNGKEYNVVGVCKDFLFEDFYTAIEPLVIQYSTRASYHILVKTYEPKKVIAELSNFLKSRSGGPFTIKPMSFLIEEMYEQEKNQQALIFVFGMLTILVSCLGMLGLTFFILAGKTKEIGIRKVNGATVSEILTLLNKDFVKWVVIAFVIACPIAYYAMHKWLENFAYKIDLAWWIFALAGILAFIIVQLTVSWQSWNAAKQNPINALRYE